jgi:hypothetical protein
MDTGRPYSRLLFRLERLNTLSAIDRQRIVDLPLKLVNYPADREIVSYGYFTSRCTLVLDGFLCDRTTLKSVNDFNWLVLSMPMFVRCPHTDVCACCL